jgi:hypothetical protein
MGVVVLSQPTELMNEYADGWSEVHWSNMKSTTICFQGNMISLIKVANCSIPDCNDAAPSNSGMLMNQLLASKH